MGAFTDGEVAGNSRYEYRLQHRIGAAAWTAASAVARAETRPATVQVAIVVSGPDEGDRLSYKYTLGSWERVEKGRDLRELPARQAVVTDDATGHMTIRDRIEMWRQAGGCRTR